VRGVPGEHIALPTGASLTLISAPLGRAKARPRQIIRERIPLQKSRRLRLVLRVRSGLSWQLDSRIAPCRREPAACSSTILFLVGLAPPAFFSWTTSPTVPLHPLFFETSSLFNAFGRPLTISLHSFESLIDIALLLRVAFNFFFVFTFLSYH
jgi:hypothetical protein